uniref:Uncharacterized protein n=2 Tax=Solanum tuberosum TaxID=4113 RepID=M1AV81_SOLTU
MLNHLYFYPYFVLVIFTYFHVFGLLHNLSFLVTTQFMLFHALIYPFFFHALFHSALPVAFHPPLLSHDIVVSSLMISVSSGSFYFNVAGSISFVRKISQNA